MKKVLAILLCGVLLSTLLSVNADSVELDQELPITKIENEQLIPCEATVNDNFVVGEIMVGIKLAYSEVNKVWSATDFPELSGITEIEDLTYADTQDAIERFSQKDNFHQILKINISGSTKANVITGIANLEQNEKVLFAEPNSILELEEPEPQTQSTNGMTRGGLALNNSNRYRKYTNDTHLEGQEGIFLHNVDKVWNAFTKGSSNVVVGVIDTGIYNHPDLSANLSLGYFCGTGTNETGYIDHHGHGTSVASVIGARGNNGQGISGVCQRVSLYSLRITDQTSSSASDDAIARAILKAEVNNIPIVNLSFGGEGYDATVETVMNMYDGLIVCSAGNDGREITNSNPCYHPSYDADNVIAVGNMTTNKTVVDDSNYSDIYVDIFASGSDVWVCNKYGNTQYFSNGGTSHAAPFVAGVAALLLSYDSTLTTAQLKQYILEGATTISALEEYCVTGGYLDAYGAFLAMLEDQTTSINLQINQVELVNQAANIETRRFEIFYQKPNVLLTEIIIPQEVEYYCTVNIDFVDSYTIAIEIEGYLMEGDLPEGIPLVELHFITYNSFAYGKAFLDCDSSIHTDIWGEDMSMEFPHELVLAGDVNLDGNINAYDNLKIQQYVAGNTTLNTTQKAAADVNGDFQVALIDSVKLGNYISNKLKSIY